MWPQSPSPWLKIEYFPHRERARAKSLCRPVLHSDPFAVKCQLGSWCVTVCNLAISCWRAFSWPAGALECVPTGTMRVHIQGTVSAGTFPSACVCVSVYRGFVSKHGSNACGMQVLEQVGPGLRQISTCTSWEAWWSVYVWLDGLPSWITAKMP